MNVAPIFTTLPYPFPLPPKMPIPIAPPSGNSGIVPSWLQTPPARPTASRWG